MHKLRGPTEGDQCAADLETVYHAHAPQVARWAGRLAGPWLDPGDVVQEVFLVVQRLLPKFRRDAAMTTWLYGITANVVRHQRRKERLRGWLGGSAEDVAGHIASGRPSPVEDLEQRQRVDLVYRALDGMRENQRTVLVLFELEKLGSEEIAELTGTKVATLRVWLHRAREQFAKRLAKLERRDQVTKRRHETD